MIVGCTRTLNACIVDETDSNRRRDELLADRPISKSLQISFLQISKSVHVTKTDEQTV